MHVAVSVVTRAEPTRASEWAKQAASMHVVRDTISPSTTCLQQEVNPEKEATRKPPTMRVQTRKPGPDTTRTLDTKALAWQASQVLMAMSLT